MNTVTTLDTELFSDNIKFVSLGKLEQKMIDFISRRHPELKELLSPEQDILFWKDRIKHIQRHKNDFQSDNEYNCCFERIPDIIHDPDYISIHPKDNSISFIKDFSAHISVAVRISSDRKLSFRTMYPLMDAQLTNYIKRGLAWKYKNL